MTPRVELWELIGPCWRLPLRVVWYAELAEVRVGAGAALTRKMRAVAEEKLLTVATPKGSNFWASREALGKVAVLSRYEDPEEVIEWTPLRPPVKVSSGGFQASEFIQSYCECHFAIIRNPLLATAVYASFCKFMMHWMLNERGTVDLLFAEMDALALRRNWQGTAARMEQKLWRAGKIKDRDLFSPDMQNIADRMSEVLTHRELTAFDEKSGTFEYTIDIRTNKKWKEFVGKLGQERLKARDGYNGMIRLLRFQLRRVIRCYAHYLEEATHPTANISCYEYDRARGKWEWYNGSRAAGPGGDPRDTSVEMRPVEEGDESAVESEAASLPGMPALQSGASDLRDTGTEPVP
jgi:hypothetical protein